MAIRKFLICNINSTNSDPDEDRSGCRKRGMIDAMKSEGHSWGSQECLPKFVVIECDLTDAEVTAYGELRKVWKDNLAYEVIDTRPVQGEIDIRVYELNPGAINQNAIAGVKAARIRNYLLAWGCSNFSLSETDANFTFNLWDAARSANFWQVPLEAMINLSFTLNSYNSQTGEATITIDYGQTQIKPEMVEQKIQEMGGTIITGDTLAMTFTLNRDTVIARFRADVKEKMEKTYMYQQHRIKESVMNQIVAAGGTATLTKSQLVAAIRDMAAE